MPLPEEFWQNLRTVHPLISPTLSLRYGKSTQTKLTTQKIKNLGPSWYRKTPVQYMLTKNSWTAVHVTCMICQFCQKGKKPSIFNWRIQMMIWNHFYNRSRRITVRHIASPKKFSFKWNYQKNFALAFLFGPAKVSWHL